MLHPTAEAFLVAVVEYEQENDGWHPTIREVAEKLGRTSTSHISYWRERLQALGYIEYRPSKSALRSTQAGRSYLELEVAR
jgi:SOS-response transcriptional repressor LexA